MGMPAGTKPSLGKHRTFSVGNILLAFIGTLFIFCAAVYLVLNFRQLYYFDIDFLHIREEVGLDDRMIRENYDALIDYNLIAKRVGELHLPSFPVSDTGRIHFEEVRRIFYAIQLTGAASLLLFAVGFAWKLRRRDFGFLKLMAVCSVAFPLVFGTVAVFAWPKIFILFHELVFKNDYWIFDPATDPVISILPDGFFFHCAVAIFLFILAGGAASGVLYKLFAQRRKRN